MAADSNPHSKNKKTDASAQSDETVFGVSPEHHQVILSSKKGNKDDNKNGNNGKSNDPEAAPASIIMQDDVRQQLLDFVNALPHLPGVYRHIGKNDEVLYVGKAKDLKKRVSSYLKATLQHSPRIALMVQQITRIETTITRTETEALLLENNLIKSLSPKYNVLFRDDKSYPYLKISKETYPRIVYYRGGVDKKSHYFGPFPNPYAVRESIKLLQKIFLLRTCNASTFSNRSRPCMLYQIKRCSAPCVGKISPEDYQKDIDASMTFLKGESDSLLTSFSQQMQEASDRLLFEQAAKWRDKISELSNLLKQQAVETQGDVLNADIIVLLQKEDKYCLTLAMIRGGRHLGDRSYFPKHTQHCVAKEVFEAFILQHYLDGEVPEMIITDQAVDDEFKTELNEVIGNKVQWVHHPREKRKIWLDMAQQNASIALARHLHESVNAKSRTQDLLDELGLHLAEDSAGDLDQSEFRVECFDISHTAGEATQASCVVYQFHAMQNNQYRRFNIKGITEGDDYAAMRQVLQRRYEVFSEEGKTERALVEDAIKDDPKADSKVDGNIPMDNESAEVEQKKRMAREWPDLILIDGGKGQLSSAVEVFEDLGLDTSILVGVSKGEGREVGLETLHFTDGRQPKKLGKLSPALMLIAQIRDEAHRFAITGMRAARGKTRNASSLEDIEGVGAKRRSALLKRFGGIQGVRNASVQDIAQTTGISVKLAQDIYKHLHADG